MSHTLQCVNISIMKDLPNSSLGLEVDCLLPVHCLKQVILEDSFCVKLDCYRNEFPCHLLPSPSAKHLGVVVDVKLTGVWVVGGRFGDHLDPNKVLKENSTHLGMCARTWGKWNSLRCLNYIPSEAKVIGNHCD